MPQAEALLRHGLFVLLGSCDRLCGSRLRRSSHLLRPAADLLHGFGLVLRRPGCHMLLDTRCMFVDRPAPGVDTGCLVLLGAPCFVLCRTGRNLLRSAGDLLHTGCRLLLGSRRQLLRSLGLVSPRRKNSKLPNQTGLSAWRVRSFFCCIESENRDFNGSEQARSLHPRNRHDRRR